MAGVTPAPRDALHPATLAVTLGREPAEPGNQVGAPLSLSSTFHAGGTTAYGRTGNQTWSAFEETLGSLEGGDALVFASGMAAVSAALSLVPHGGVVLAPAEAYNGVVATLAERHRTGALEVRAVDVTDAAEVGAALGGADLLWLESPTNPLLALADVPALTRAAHEQGALVVADNTFATPLLQRPLEHGVDVVVHSVTKYLAGHSDVVLGAAVTPATGPGRALHERLARHRELHGAIAGPMEVWLALRGIRTLHLRVERACSNAAELVARLRSHPAVQRVRYPGFGAIVSVEVAGGVHGAERLASATRIWVHSTSLGGVESQLERRRRQPAEPKTVPENLVRLSVGVEDVEDLWDDLDRALHHAVGSAAG